MKGNIAINKSIAKGIENGKIVQNLPEAQFGGRMVPLFTPISPVQCSLCGSPLKINEHYDRFIISSYGIIECPVIYWICSNPKCETHHSDTLIGVTGSANYSDELKNVSLKYLDEFGSVENIPSNEVELYEATTDLILAETAIDSTIYYQKILKMVAGMKLSKASKKVVAYMKEIYVKNIKNLEKGFTPETNNVMEQLFSLINDFMNQARSFKINESLSNFCYNLFTSLNNKIFNTGLWKGFSPVQRAKIKYG
ncbi:hypothetical protein METP3_02869 [Methanosarcinales archaeon]|nr:hypothetical protein METP3_02869 [Methanosarcinales archaeon]